MFFALPTVWTCEAPCPGTGRDGPEPGTALYLISTWEVSPLLKELLLGRVLHCPPPLMPEESHVTLSQWQKGTPRGCPWHGRAGQAMALHVSHDLADLRGREHSGLGCPWSLLRCSGNEWPFHAAFGY